MKNRKQKFINVLCTVGETIGILVIILGILVIFIAKYYSLTDRIIGMIVICLGGFMTFFLPYDYKHRKKEVDEIRKEAKESVERAFNVVNPREIFFHSPSHYCNEATMLYTIISNSNIKFYATINDDKSITVTAIDGEKKIYQENISNYVYFSNLFYFRKLDADG